MPVYPWLRMYEIGRPPIRVGSSDAPITATDAGLSSLAMRDRSVGRARGVVAAEELLVVLMPGVSRLVVL